MNESALLLLIALIVANGAVLGRAAALAPRNPVVASAADGLFLRPGFPRARLVLGLIRAQPASGTLLSPARPRHGSAFSLVEITLLPGCGGPLPGILPPGGLAVAGLLLAARHYPQPHLADHEETAGTPRLAAV